MYEHVVVGVSDSDAAAHAVEQALELARVSGGTIHLVSAFGTHRPKPPTMPEEFRYSIGSIDPVDWRLSQFEAAAKAASIAVSTHSVLGDPVEALTRVAREEAADLIVVGASSVHGARDRATVADALVRQSDCAVLVVEAPAREPASAASH